MSTFLFDKIVYGPVRSRRLGVSLGVNLLPADGKLCSFNCIYCECGLNEEHRTDSRLPSRKEIRKALECKLFSLQAENNIPDAITFAGNGEPTLHPEFAGIVEDTVSFRDRCFPGVKIAVLSNATMLHKENIFRALNKVDENILKLDAARDSQIRKIDAPNNPAFTFGLLMEQLLRFDGNLTIQTMFLRGDGIDNTTEEDIASWTQALKQINPKQVMIYTVDRETPVKGLRKVPGEELERIAAKVRPEGIDIRVSG